MERNLFIYQHKIKRKLVNNFQQFSHTKTQTGLVSMAINLHVSCVNKVNSFIPFEPHNVPYLHSRNHQKDFGISEFNSSYHKNELSVFFFYAYINTFIMDVILKTKIKIKTNIHKTIIRYGINIPEQKKK